MDSRIGSESLVEACRIGYWGHRMHSLMVYGMTADEESSCEHRLQYGGLCWKGTGTLRDEGGAETIEYYDLYFCTECSCEMAIFHRVEQL